MSSSPTQFASLDVENICKNYAGKPVLESVSLRVEKGEVVGLLGPNGAGKTTLMKVISGLAREESGRILLDGRPAGEDREGSRRRVGVIPQENNLERELTVRQALHCYSMLFGVRDFERRRAEIGKIINLDGVWEKRVRHLSGGYARRAMIARALLPDPGLLLLDEPSVGLDPDVREQLWALIRSLSEAGKGVLITTHYMEEAAQLCDRIYFLQNGKMAWHGTPQELKEADSSLEHLFLQLARGELS